MFREVVCECHYPSSCNFRKRAIRTETLLLLSRRKAVDSFSPGGGANSGNRGEYGPFGYPPSDKNHNSRKFDSRFRDLNSGRYTGEF